MRTVWIYVDHHKEVGDPDHIKVLETAFAAERWFEDSDPIGTAFEYPVIGASSGEPGKPDDDFFESPAG
jgi:hypothetical protein